MVEEGEEVQSQETELETEEEGMPTQADIPSVTDASFSQEPLASQTETTPSHTGASSSPEAISAVSEITGAASGPEAVPPEAGTHQDTTPAPEATK